ncbi:MAG: hypothetical protein WC768_01005 [Patescibacteria group bacterium]|jgi:hypothetical protein
MKRIISIFTLAIAVSAIIVLSAAETNAATKYADGVFIRAASGKIYLIKEQKKFYISSPAELGLYGKIKLYNVSDGVIDSFANYTSSIVGNNARSFLKSPDGKIYLVENQKKRHITTLTELKSFGFIKLVNATYETINAYPDLTQSDYTDGSLLRLDSGKIYLLDNGNVRYISSIAELKQLGLKKMYNVTLDVLNKYQVSVCDSATHREGNVCVADSKPCSVGNGAGYQNWSSDGWSNCVASTCNSGYQVKDGLCAASTCDSDKHLENGICKDNYEVCIISNGTGHRIWDFINWTGCEVDSCNSGYYEKNFSCVPNVCSSDQHLENGVCVIDVTPCTVANGYGVKSWSDTANQWSSCNASSCFSGYNQVQQNGVWVCR